MALLFERNARYLPVLLFIRQTAVRLLCGLILFFSCCAGDTQGLVSGFLVKRLSVCVYKMRCGLVFVMVL